jgi:hypothetical protein
LLILSSTKLENSFCLVVRGWGEKGEDGGRWGEMNQTLYAHMNKRNKKNQSTGVQGKGFFFVVFILQ